MPEPGNPLDIEENRIRAVFGLPAHAPLPSVSKETLAQYHEYLFGKLSFPFQALYAETAPPVKQVVRYVTVIGLSDNAKRRQYGLFCKVDFGDRMVELPIAEMGMQEDDPNRQLIDDYLFWLWSGR
ncbi:MAG: hypothetical protein GXY83_44255 [Rhodopirellula sp.]|nr:hypothetical protein [Rhodopirellula sp.]